jgi:hypothetical protein
MFKMGSHDPFEYFKTHVRAKIMVGNLTPDH